MTNLVEQFLNGETVLLVVAFSSVPFLFQNKDKDNNKNLKKNLEY